MAKNVRNERWKEKPKFNVEEVNHVEQQLKEMIDHGFTENVEEELLEFDQTGQLVKITKGGLRPVDDGGDKNLAERIDDFDGYDSGSVVSSSAIDDSSAYHGVTKSAKSLKLKDYSDMQSDVGLFNSKGGLDNRLAPNMMMSQATPGKGMKSEATSDDKLFDGGNIEAIEEAAFSTTPVEYYDLPPAIL